MSDLASLYIKVDSKGVVTASKDLNKLTNDSKKTETATEGVTKSFSKLQAVVVALASSYALLKMAQYIKDAALLAARYETLGVVMRVVGNNAGYTGAQMDKFARGLQKAGIAMVESRNTLARMIQAQIDLTNSQKLARIAQDAAVIGNINSSEAFERMIYGLQTGMPRILRTIGLNVSFQKSLEKLADTLGIKKDALSEVQVMQARVNAVVKAGVLITGTYEAAMGTAGKKITSFIRYVEDFKAKMGLAFGPATVTLVDAATQAMKDMQEQISRPEAQEALRDLSSQLAETIVKIGKNLPKAIETMTIAVNALASAFSTIVSIWTHPVWDKMDKFFGAMSDSAWQEGMRAAANKMSPEFHKISESMDKFISQFEKMQEMLSKGITTRLDFALEDPDKYFGEMIAEKLAWEKEGFESIEKWYKWIETLAQEKMDSILELEDEETRVFEENLAYRLVILKKYYENIEMAAQEERDSDAEWEDQLLRSEKEKADYQKELANESNDYIDKLAEAASYYKDLIGFEETYHEKMLELIEERRKAEIDAGEDVAAANAKARKSQNDLAEEAYNTEISHIQSQLKGYSDMFGGLSQLYDEDSSERKRLHDISMAFQVAEQAIMLATAVRAAVIAIATQGAGDPYTAFARVAAMTGLMAATLAKAGISFGSGGGGVSASSPPASTVLGADTGTGSQSIANVWELLEDTYGMEYRELSGIHDEMKNLNDNISGLVASIFRTGGIDSFNISTGTSLGGMQQIWDKIGNIILFGFAGLVPKILNTLTFGISGWLSDTVSSVVGSIFGGGTSKKVIGSGISTGEASVGTLAAGGGIGSQAYTDIKKVTEGGWFSSGSTERYTKYYDLDEDVSKLLDLVFQDMSAVLIELTHGLGTDMDATLAYIFEDTKIDLQGMDSDEINKALTEHFSALGDIAVEALFGDLLGVYQEVGEGLMETAARILIDKAVVLEALEMTGQAFTGTIPEIIEFSEAIIAMAGDLETFYENVETYYDKFFSDAEKQIRLQGQLTKAFDDLNMVLPDTRDGYRALIEGLDLTTEAGQQAYVSLLAMSESADEYYSTIEQLAANRASLEIQLMKLTGDAAGALAAQRKIELAAMDESLRPLQERIYVLEDEARAVEETKQLAANRASLEIQLMKLTGDAAGALAAQRKIELAAMDESLRPLQERIYVLEDEARAVEALKSSLQTLISQGQMIQDFINSLGITEMAMTLSAARAAYASDLAGAQAGDPESYNRITQSAGTLISTAEQIAEISISEARQTVGSAVELARIEAKSKNEMAIIIEDIKSELSALQPVIDLESNIELLKAIREATSDTATATQQLDLLGIKAIFDLEQVLTLIYNSEGLPDYLKEMIANQTGDYMLWLQAQLDSSVSDDLKRILIDGAGIYATTVNAALGTIDEESQKLALIAAGTYTATINALLGTIDPESQKLALEAQGVYEAKIRALFESADPESQRLALEAAGIFETSVIAAFGGADAESQKLALEAARIYIAIVNGVFGTADEESQKLALIAAGTYTAIVDSIMGNDGLDEATKILALTAGNEFLALVNASLGVIDPVARQLALNTANTISSIINASLGVIDPVARQLALNTANTISSIINASLGVIDPVARQLALNTANTISSIINASLGVIDPVAQQLALNASNTLATIVTAALGVVDPVAQQLALNTANTISSIINASLGVIDPVAQQLALNASNTLATIVTAALGVVDPVAQQLALNTANTISSIINASLGVIDPVAQQLALNASNTLATIVTAALGVVDPVAQQLALDTSNTLAVTVETALGYTNSVAQQLALNASNTLAATITAALGVIDPRAQALGLNSANILASTVTAAFGFTDPGAIALATQTANTLAANVTAALGDSNPKALTLATQHVNEFEAIIVAALSNDLTTQQLAYLFEDAQLTTTVDGTMTWNPNDPLKAIWDAIQAATEATANAVGKYAIYKESESHDKGRWNVYSGSDEMVHKGSQFSFYGMTPEQAASKIAVAAPHFAEGGIATGSESGYAATLHGTELVVSPSTSYPATIKGGDVSNDQTEELKKIRQTIESGNFASVKNSNKIAKILARFDDDGLPHGEIGIK